MSEADLLKQICDDLDAAIAIRLATKEGAEDCVGECHAAYDRCYAKADTTAEQAACKAIYNKCIANC